MFKNMKVGTKISFGFAIVLILTMGLAGSVAVTTILSNNNLKTINVLTVFQTEANHFVDNFSDARIGANVMYVKSDSDEYDRAVSGYNSAMESLARLETQMNNEPSLSIFRNKIAEVKTELGKWKGYLDSVNDVNKTLDKQHAHFVETGEIMTVAMQAIYDGQFEDLEIDIQARKNEASMLRRRDRLRFATDLLANTHIMRRSFLHMLDLNDLSIVPDALALANAMMEDIIKFTDEAAQQKNRDLGLAAQEQLQQYIDLVDDYTSNINKHNEYVDLSRQEATSAFNSIMSMMTEINNLSDNDLINATNMGQTALAVAIIMSLIALLAGIITAVLIIKSITGPVQAMAAAAAKMADGDLNLGNLTYRSNDEIGQLTVSMQNMARVINDLIKGMNELSNDHDKGEIEARVDESRFKGAYRNLAVGTNKLVEGYVQHILDIIECLSQFGDGNFDVKVTQLPGKKASLNTSVETFRKNLKGIANEISVLVNAAQDGALSTRADAQRYKGDWSELLKRLNALVQSIVDPLSESSNVIMKISEGNFDQKMTGDYHGDFLLLKNAVNSTVTNVSGYIAEISDVLGSMANDDLNQEVTRDYVGDFLNIKTALNKIISKFNNVISDISSAAEQVSAGSRQVSESSMTLATGATEQASSVEELNATIQTINESTLQNAESAKKAEALSDSSKNNAAKGDQDMNEMLTAMEGIKESSNSISKIIKTIDDIAFQTNLLALNAAVEAARAGDHGKGFAVVAEEVRSLASKSLEASKNTASLIEESINRVTDGTMLAGKTADALRTIINDVSQVADIITDIASASKEQSVAISQVMEGISQITEVVQNNSATSEESASASQELSSQAEVLRNMVSVFTLK